MSKTTAPPEPSTLTRRVLLCPQSHGRTGKSTLADFLIAWWHYARIDGVALDLDGVHRTLSKRYPDKVSFFPATNSLNDFSLMLDALPSLPVILADMPSGATPFLIRAFNHFRLLDTWRKDGAQVTFLIFAVDDPEAISSARRTLAAFGDQADYLLIENTVDGRFRSDRFYDSDLGYKFTELGTLKLFMPAITLAAQRAWGRAQADLKRNLSLDEVPKAAGLSPYNEAEFAYLRNVMFAQFEDAASLLLPDSALIQARVPRLAVRSSSNGENDPGELGTV